MAEQEQPTTATTGRSGNGKNLSERLRDAGAKPVMALESEKDRSEMPMAQIVEEWFGNASQHYRYAGEELTRRWAREMLALKQRELAYFEAMLSKLTK
jgi:hypothetical protein